MSDPFTFGGEIVWRPTPAHIARSHLRTFMDRHGIARFADLQARSTTDIAWFTEAVLDYLDIQFQRPYTQVVDLSAGIQRPVWCVDGHLNIAYNCVDKWAADPAMATRPALIWEGEEETVRSLTYGELATAVNRCANGLRELGLGKGDGIGLYLSMTPEICVALLAIAKIGGVILPLFSGYGVGAIETRLNDAQAKALITADGFFRRGRVVGLKETADAAAAHIPSLEHMIVVRRVGNPVAMEKGRDHWWHELIDRQPETAALEPTAAEDLLMIIYTSGTTGRPKGTVHTHCGFPIKAAQDMAFGTDVHRGDRIYWMSDMGWMMGPWLVFGATLLGATFFIYDGAPDYPGPDRLWSLAARHKINVLGVSPTLIRALIPHGDALVKQHDLSAITCFASTGEPWNPDPWRWLFEVVGESKRPIINYSGGTEIGGGIVMGNPILPLKPAAFSAPCPGMAADVVDEAGNPVRNRVGELVIRQPWIGMTRSFWQDDDRYLNTYWSHFDDVWVHGDWAAIDEDGMWYILGRSDDTIKVAGKRLGPAEIESVLVSHAAVSEAAAIGVPDQLKGNVVVCFCVLTPGHEPSDDLARELRQKVADEMGKPLQPKEIRFVSAIPQTRNAKVMRRIIRSAYLGQDPGDTSSLVNPEAVAEIQNVKRGTWHVKREP
ncbi:MAG: AMP-binding protein [Chloroflexota bacterium]